METLSADLLRALSSIDDDSDAEPTPSAPPSLEDFLKSLAILVHNVSEVPTSLEDFLKRLDILVHESSSSKTTSADVEPILPWQVDLPVDETPPFNYVYKRLVTEKEQLISLGESPTRSLSIAFAVMRGSLTNIYATRRFPGTKFWSRDDFLQRIEDSISRADDNWPLLQRHFRYEIDTETEYAQFIDHTMDEMDEMTCLGNFSLETDARKLSKDFGFPHAVHKHIFFQCPWDGWGGQTGKLLQDTTHSVAEIQQPGDLLLFGLRDTSIKPPPYETLYLKYEKEYDIPTLQSTAESRGYKYLGKDKDLIHHCLRFGYHHWSETGVNLHEIMLEGDEFVVYIFVKMSST